MDSQRTDQQPREFPNTQWSMVVAARGTATPATRAALERLVRSYWGPVYWIIRRAWNQNAEDAKDLTQEFLSRLVDGGLEGFERERGRFRAFLHGAVKHFMLQHKRDQSRQKRGGGQVPVSIDEMNEVGLPPPDAQATPEQVFDQQWAAALLREGVAELNEECRLSGREGRFLLFERYDLTEGERPTYEQLAQDAGISVREVYNQLKEMRERLREILKARVRETLADPGELDDEMRALFG